MTEPNALIIQAPSTPAAQLIVLFHGVGAHAQHMQHVGQALARTFAQAYVVCVNAPYPSGHANGFEWFSVAGIDEDNRPQRVAQAMPEFARTVQHWQARSGVGAAATALVGFSQGAIMALESLNLTPPLSRRVVAISGRFAALPHTLAYAGSVHLLHGKSDAVIPYAHTVHAAHHLRALGVDMTAEVVPFVGHEIPAEFIDMICTKLLNHLPPQAWEQGQDTKTQAPPH